MARQYELMVTPVPAAPKSKPKEGSAAPKKEAATPQTEPPTKKMPPAYNVEDEAGASGAEE